MNAEQEAACLQAYPFEGDFGVPGDRVFKDRFGTARKAGPCADCQQPIQPGDRVRLLTGKFDGDLRDYRWCTACCIAMASTESGQP